MGNIKRYYENNGAYFLTTVTKNRIEIFKDPNCCKILLVTIEYFKLILDYRLYGFCIMPEHLHLLIHPFGKYNFSYIMKMIKGSFASKFNKIRGRQGKIWQKGFYDECILDSIKLINKLDYIHNNPVRAILVTSPEEYLYSSYNHYIKSTSSQYHIIEIDAPSW